MFRTKPTTIATIVTKNLKHDNVLVNVVIDVMTRQHAFRKHEPMKAKAIVDW
jgi:hypothetical protein